MMNLFKYLPIIMRLLPMVGQIVDALRTGKLVEFLRGQGGELWNVLLEIAAGLWPGLEPEAAVQAAALKTFDQSTVRVIQDSLNKLNIVSPPLVVDGDYGELTKAAVQVLQKKYAIEEDGWAGPKTQLLLQTEVAKLTTVNPKK